MIEADIDTTTTITEVNPDAALLKLIDKHRGLRRKSLAARTLMWELLHRAARTPEGHDAKWKMIAGSTFAAPGSCNDRMADGL